MKKQNLMKSMFTMLLLIVGIVFIQSCQKSKARKNIEGVWTYQSSTIDGEANPITISGTYEFKKCSGSANRKGTCEMVQDLTLEYMGATEEANETLKYRITKGQKGLELVLDDTVFEMDLTENTLTLTSYENGEVLVMNFTK